MKRLYTLGAAILLFSSSIFAQLLINEVLYDPSNSGLDGDANGDGSYDQEGDAFIEFFNDSYSNFDISGYEIWDDTTSGSLVYTFPNSTIIPPKGALVVFGGGTPTGSFGGAVVLADTGTAGLSLNNSGEIIIIKDDSGNPILSFDSDALSNNPNESYTRNPDITGSFEQHADNTTLLFSPGTKIDGSSFDTTLAVDVSFSVDLSKYEGTIGTVYVAGDFNGWCGTCNVMTDDDGDQVYDVTLPLTNDSIEYKFTMDNFAVEESFSGGESCTKTTGQFTNRFAIISGTTMLPTVCFNSCGSCATGGLRLQGVMDFTTPDAGVTGKAVHVVADSAIPHLNIYGIGVANNGGGTDGQEYTFPNIAVEAGDQIIVVRDSQAIANYFSTCWSEFDIILVDAGGSISQNGDDAIELFRANAVIETLGDPDTDGTGEIWEYTDAWAYQTDTGWMYAAPNCTDNTTTIFDADCVYPICLSKEVASITVTGENDATTITTPAGTLQMIATVMPADADDKTVTWSVDDNTIATIDASGVLTAATNGSVVVTATSNDGSGVSGNTTIAISGQVSHVSDLNLAGVSVYPNPSENTINIKANAPIKSLTIFSISGNIVDVPTLVNGIQDISMLASGTYFIEVHTDLGVSQVRFIKK